MKCFIAYEPNDNYIIFHAKDIKQAIKIIKDIEKSSKENEQYNQIIEIIRTYKKQENKKWELVFDNINEY